MGGGSGGGCVSLVLVIVTTILLIAILNGPRWLGINGFWDCLEGEPCEAPVALLQAALAVFIIVVNGVLQWLIHME